MCPHFETTIFAFNATAECRRLGLHVPEDDGFFTHFPAGSRNYRCAGRGDGDSCCSNVTWPFGKEGQDCAHAT